MTGRNTVQYKFKLTIAVLTLLASICIHKATIMASAAEVPEEYTLIYSSKQPVENESTNDDHNTGGEFSWLDEEEELSHKPFTTEVPEGYTPIRSIDELQGISTNPSGKYILMNDIDMTQETSPGGSWDTGHGWTPLKGFSGTFDGNGYRIIGMHIYGDVEDLSYYIGLFAELEAGSIIRNLGMVDCDINVSAAYPYYYSTSFYIGAIAGRAHGDIRDKSIISKCYIDGKIRASAGGAVGFLVGGAAGVGDEISDCCNMAEISVQNGTPKEHRIGGIAGGGDIQRCYNIGKINVTPDIEYIGAIVGYNASLSESASNYYLDGTASVGDGYYDDDSYHGCKVLTDAQMRRASSFIGFSFNSENIWKIDELSVYPYPQLRSCPQVRVEKLELTKYPDKLTYSQGDVLDLSGARFSIIYEDGVVTSTGLNADMASGVDMDKEGTQNVVVTYLNASCSFDITVEEMKASGISLSKKKCSLARNKKIQLNAVITPSNVTDKSVQWTSDNEVVATVTNQGIVRGVNAGIARITATTGNGLSASCVVTVTVPAKSITLNKTSLTLKKGSQKKLKVTLNPLESTDLIEWSSSDPGIATVNSKGLIKAKKKGYATIMAKTSSGKRAYVKISVK